MEETSKAGARPEYIVWGRAIAPTYGKHGSVSLYWGSGEYASSEVQR